MDYHKLLNKFNQRQKAAITETQNAIITRLNITNNKFPTPYADVKAQHLAEIKKSKEKYPHSTLEHHQMY